MTKKKKKDLQSTTKKALFFLLGNGVLWVWCSYLLAFLDKMTIAEQLSEIAITEILGVFFVYAVKSLFENLSKHNNWPDKKKTKEEEVNEDTNKEINTDLPDLTNWEGAKGDD